jgi:hypothetical protein
MSNLLFAVIVFLTIVIGIYFTTRKTPPPFIPKTVCSVDSDCIFPQTCNVSAGVCTDDVLPKLLTDAQNAAQALYTELQKIAYNFQNVYPLHVQNLITSSVAMGISAPSQDLVDDLKTSQNTAITGINSFITNVLEDPNCESGNVNTSSNCGYYFNLMPLTPSSEPVSIWSAANDAKLVDQQIEAVTGNFVSVVANLTTLVSRISGSGTLLTGNTVIGVTLVNNDIAEINDYSNSLTAMANAVKTTGLALYGHYFTV